MPEPEAEFEDLLRKARQGDAAAMSAIAATYEEDLRIAARFHLGMALRPYLDTLDLVQSVHRTLMVGLRSEKFDISSPQKLVALVLTMVRRKAAHHWRRHRRQLRSRESIQEQFTQECRSSNDPARQAAHQDSVTVLWTMLSDEERHLIELRLLGHSNVETARLTGQPAETVRVRLFRLRHRLKNRGVDAGWLD
jgi:RNA polymerase sigma-70 factor (ECF subfamily)